jgi:hypothetical protein
MWAFVCHLIFTGVPLFQTFHVQNLEIMAPTLQVTLL